MAYHWPADIVFRELTLEVEDRTCGQCQRPRTICCHRQRRFFTCDGPVQLLCKLCHCSNPVCPGRQTTVSPEAETALVMPYWVLGWDVFAWLGHRRFARHWSVPQIHGELRDRFAIPLSVDAVERYVGRYQRMLAARQHDPAAVARAYRRAKGLVLSIDGLQPEKGHETLYVVREIGQKRVWFAEALLSSGAAEVQRVLARARAWVERLGLPVRCWISDKQDAFVTGIAAEFPHVPHRYCRNHFLRALAQPVLALDSHAKVRLRRRVRGLRAIERAVLEQRRPDPVAPPSSSPPRIAQPHTGVGEVVLDYCTAVRGILNDGQGGPLHPPGLRLAEALREVRQSLDRNLQAKKGAVRKRNSNSLPGASTKDWSRSNRCSNRLGAISRICGRWTPRSILRTTLTANVGTASTNSASTLPDARIRSASISAR
jgi:hypothetical protein